MKLMKSWMLAAIFVFCGSVTILTSCSKNEDDYRVVTDYFPLWNQCDALTTLQEYVQDVTNPDSKNFIPMEDRIVTFDMDGTFLGELYPTYFEYNLLIYRVFEDLGYKDKAPDDVREAAQAISDFVRKGTPLPAGFEMQHARAAAKAFAGMTLAEYDSYIKNFASKQANGFAGMTYGESFYKPMLNVFKYLNANGFTSYVVSGTDRFICRALVESLGIAPNMVIGMDVKLKSSSQGDEAGVYYTMGREEDLVRTDEVILKNIKTNKVVQISQEIGKIPVLSFGNSSGDCAMHNYCLSNKKYRTEVFMLVANDTVRDHADLAEAARRDSAWRANGYHVISMKDDFRTIYGDHVKKVDFTFTDNE